MRPPPRCRRTIATPTNVARLDFRYTQEFTPFALAPADQIRSDMSTDRACCSDRRQMVSSASQRRKTKDQRPTSGWSFVLGPWSKSATICRRVTRAWGWRAMAKTLVIINPWAGRGAAGRRRPELEATLAQAGVEYAVVTTHAHGGAIELAWQGVERGYERIVAVGGDGTINEVVNGIKGAEAGLGRRAQLGIIPLGTGSDFVKVLEGVEPNDLAGGARRLAGDRLKSVDLGRVRVGDDEPRFFINALGMGFDAQAAAEALKLTKLKGMAVYLVAIIKALANYKAH